MTSSPPIIPFLSGKDVCQRVASLHASAPLARILLSDMKRLKPYIPSIPLWIDAGIDGLHDLANSTPNNKNKNKDPRQDWFDTVSQFDHYQDIADGQFQAKPIKKKVAAFVSAVLDAANIHNPEAISVPQLPHVDGSGRNKINKALAKVAAEWQIDHPDVALILPVILTHSKQSQKKTARNAHVKLAVDCVKASDADACWIVDASFSDEEQSADLRGRRMKGLVNFHEEFNAKLADKRIETIAGPYWGLNLLLWSRGLIDSLGIGVGSGYRYYISGGYPTSGTPRIALPPLYRRAKTGVELRRWVDSAIKQLGTGHPFYAELVKIKPLATTTRATAQKQLATFYRDWIDSLAAAPPTGRAMTLFQSLSIAFSYGKKLNDDFPEDVTSELTGEGTTRAPESIVEPLMLNCL